MRGTEFAELEAFSAVAMQGSFVKAAVFLGVSVSTLSQAVRSLEERIGYSLFNRSTRHVSLTEAGNQMLIKVRPAIDELRLAVRAAKAMKDRALGTLRLSVSNVPATMIIAPVMADFLLQNPGIAMEITVDDSMSDIVTGHFDAGIRHGSRIGLDMTAVQVTKKSRVVVLASPEYLARFGLPELPRDLQTHNCIRLRMADGTFFRWHFEKTGTNVEVEVGGQLVVNTVDLMVRAAVDGVGMIYLTEEYAEPLIEEGRLVALLKDWSPAPASYFLYHARTKKISEPLDLLIHFLIKRIVPPDPGPEKNS